MLLIDFFINFLPKNISIKLVKKLNISADYVFIVHSRDYHDLNRKFSLLNNRVPYKILSFIGKYLFPIRLSYIYGLKYSNIEKRGLFIGSPMDASDMTKNRELATKKILKAAKFAEKLGAKIIGLGALSASFTRNGLDIKDKINCRLTTGHSYTAWVVSNNAIRMKNLTSKELTIGIVGAAGSIGSSCYAVLTDHFKKFILVDKDMEKLKSKFNLSSEKILSYSSSLDIIKKADIIITATNAPYSIIQSSNMLKEGTIIIDDAQPLNASKKINSKNHRTLVIEGGVCNYKNIKYNFDLGLTDDGDIFSCMGELITLAALDSNCTTIGDTNKEQIIRIKKMANVIGIEPARFRSFGRPISDDYLKYILS
ncbi:MAG: hypothetical protein WCV69_01230 [Patescibacteria group bacterium]|jgi:predicted amino acid dehydrogenase